MAKRCKHASCGCTVLDGKEFCGDACEEDGKTGSPGSRQCTCGHPECGTLRIT